MKVVYIVFSLYYLLFEPVFGYIFFKQFVKLPAGIIAGIILIGQLPAADLGISWIKFNDNIFGKWIT